MEIIQRVAKTYWSFFFRSIVAVCYYSTWNLAMRLSKNRYLKLQPITGSFRKAHFPFHSVPVAF